MGNKYLDTALFDKAAEFAIRAHSNTERRAKGFPYIIHPMEAASIVATITSDQELLSAAILHDVVEDTDVTVEEIEKVFGARVAALVASESDPVFEGKSEEETWHQRKQFAIDRLSKASYEAKIVAMGDKLSNLRAIVNDYEVIGDAIWNRFHVKDPAEHEWHYRGLGQALSELSDTAAYREFQQLLDRIFNK